MHLLAKVVAGSRLYGAAVEGVSDTDFRSCYLPSLEDCVLQTVSRAIENPEEEDSTTFSYQYLLKMLQDGQGVALEMICAPDEAVIESSPIFEELRKSRKLFFTKKMGALLRFSKAMTAKYSLKIERLQITREVVKIIMPYVSRTDKTFRLGDLWDELPVTEYTEKTTNERNTNKDNRCYVVCGRQLQATLPVISALQTLSQLIDSYGQRVKNSEENNFCYKSIGHAFRALYQAKAILAENDLTFPLQNAEWLRDVRLGKFHFINDGLQSKLDDLLVETEDAVEKSNLPETVGHKIIKDLILKAYNL